MSYSATLTGSGWEVGPIVGGALGGGGIPSYTWDSKPAPDSVEPWTLIRITGPMVAGFWESDGTYWRYLRDVPLMANGLPGTTTSGTAQTVLATIPVPALALADNGRVEVEFLLSYPNNANSKSFFLRLGGTGIDGALLWEHSVTTTTKALCRAGFMNRNSVSSQVQTASDFGTGYGATTVAVRTAAVNTAVDTNVYLTATCANGADLITLEHITARLA